MLAHPGDVEGHLAPMEFHHRAVKAPTPPPPGAIDAHLRAMEVNSGAKEAYPRTLEAHSGAVEAHSEAVEWRLSL